MFDNSVSTHVVHTSKYLESNFVIIFHNRSEMLSQTCVRRPVPLGVLTGFEEMVSAMLHVIVLHASGTAATALRGGRRLRQPLFLRRRPLLRLLLHADGELLTTDLRRVSITHALRAKISRWFRRFRDSHVHNLNNLLDATSCSSTGGGPCLPE